MKTRRNKILTPEQKATWDSIVGVKKRERKKPTPQARWDYPPTPSEQYMKNWLFCIEEYKAGRTTQERAKKAARHLIEHCNTIINEPIK